MCDEKQLKCWKGASRISWIWVNIISIIGFFLMAGIIFFAKLILTPSTASVTDVEPTLFYYYHRNDLAQNLSREGVAALPIRPESVIYFYIHGFQSPSLEEAESLKVKDAILEGVKEVDVVVLVDWCEASKPGWQEVFSYPAVASSTVPIIAAHVKEEIKWVERNLGISRRSRIRMAGHSLGAHIMGRAGELLYAEEGGDKIGKMVGLDPAGPLFDDVFPGEDHRLSRDDADLVLCIHTDDTLGTTNRSFCDKHLYPTLEKDTCSSLGCICRHNSVKGLFIDNLNHCSSLVDKELGIGMWDKGIRGLLQTFLRDVTIAAHYAPWVGFCQTLMIVFGIIGAVMLVLCCTNFSCIWCWCRKKGEPTHHGDIDGGGEYVSVRTNIANDV